MLQAFGRCVCSDDRERWLACARLLALDFDQTIDAFYQENIGERWSTGRLDDGIQFDQAELFAA